MSGANFLRNSHELAVDLVTPSLERVFEKKTIFGEKLKHVLEPRATYRYVSGIGTDFIRAIRFDESDLLSDTNELELSLTNRLYAKRGGVVREVLTWEIRQKRYFDPTFGGAVVPGQRNVMASSADLTGYSFLNGPRDYSPVASILRASMLTGLSLEWRADYDPSRRAVINSALSVDYRRAKVLPLRGTQPGS